MRTTGYSDVQIVAITVGVPMAKLRREHGMTPLPGRRCLQRRAGARVSEPPHNPSHECPSVYRGLQAPPAGQRGAQFTSFAWTDRLKRIGAPISLSAIACNRLPAMDGKGRCMDMHLPCW
jgi:hypothetical protein